MKRIASVSLGKDSTAMLHLLLERGIVPDEVVSFECEWDFPQMVAHRKLVEEKTGLHIIMVRNYRHFNDLLRHYGWPHSSGGWCTACKRDTLLKYLRARKCECEYVGFSADEQKRADKLVANSRRKWKTEFPLIDAAMTGTDALKYCRGLGYTWNGLYDVFNRVGCFCCPKGGKGKRRKVQGLNFLS